MDETSIYTKTATNQKTGERVGFNPNTLKWEQIRAPNPTGVVSEAVNAAGRGTELLKASVSEGVPAMAKGLVNEAANFLGMDDIADPSVNFKQFGEKMQDAYDRYPTEYDSFLDVGDHGVGKFIAGALGEQAPQIAATVVGSVLGSKIKGAQKTLELGRALTKAEKTAESIKGGVIGAGVVSGVQNIPESYLNAGEDNAGVGLVAGGMKTFLDVALPAKIINRLLGPMGNDVVADVAINKFVKVGKQAGKDALLEGGTEATQTLIDQIATQIVDSNANSLFSPENLISLGDAAIKGAIGGGAVSGIASAFEPGMVGDQSPTDFATEYNKLDERQKKTLDESFAEEDLGVTKILANSAELANDSVLTPLYIPEDSLVTMSEKGIDSESVGLLNPTYDNVPKGVFVDPSNVFSEAMTPQDILTNVTAGMNPDTLAARRKGISEGKRTDDDFMPGDGEIVATPPEVEAQAQPTVTPAFIIGPKRNPYNRMKMTDNQENPPKTSRKKPAKASPAPVAPPLRLPKDLRGGKPRYDKAALNFPSDVEKALYTVNPNSKKSSKRDKEYKQWLVEKAGIKESDIPALSKQVKESVQKIFNENDTLATIDVPSINHTAPTKAKLKTPPKGSVQSSIIEPTIALNNIKFSELTPEAEAKYKDFIEGAQRIIKEIAGEGANAQFKPFESIKLGLDNDYALGAQFMNVVAVALNTSTKGQQVETLYHEIWHLMERLGVVKDADQFTEQLLPYLYNDPVWQGVDVQPLLVSREGREEIRANAFGKWVVENVNTGTLDGYMTVPKIIPKALHGPYRRAIDYVRKMRNMLKGQGFNSYEDVFKSVYEGQRAVDLLDNLNYNNRVARLQRMANSFQDTHQNVMDGTFDEIVQDAKRSSNRKYDQTGGIGFFTRFLSSYQHAASKDMMICQTFNMFRRKEQNFNRFLTKYSNIMPNYLGSNKATRYRIHDLMDFCRNSSQKAYLDDEGFLNFERDGRNVRIKDVEISKKYVELQNAYAEQLTDYENAMKFTASARNQDVLPRANFSSDDLNVAIALLEGDIAESNQPQLLERRIADLKALAERMHDISEMRKVDYSPRQRYGRWAITVRNKDGEQVDLFTIEDGDALGNMSLKAKDNILNQYQVEETLKKLREKYSDTTKYDIIGEGGKIKNLSSASNLKPFLLTKNTLTEQLDKRFLNLDLLTSLLGSKGVDPESFEDLRKDLLTDVATSGYRNRFRQSDKMGVGYSKDWDRVVSSSFGGSSQFFANVPFQHELSTLSTAIGELKDEKLKKKLNDYIGYVGSPTEDYQSLRTFNFMWAMGGNITTAMLQYYTLPSVTLANMNAYNPNIMQNMKMLSKWFGVATKFITTIPKTFYSHDGMCFFNFGDPAVLEQLVKTKVLTEKQAEYLAKEFVTLRGGQVEDMTGHVPFDTRSMGGDIKKKLSKFGYFLGAPISLSEQMTRFTTTMAAFDMFESNQGAVERAKKILKDDQRFVAMMKDKKGYSLNENLAAFVTDESHAVFGKQGRPEMFRGLGGSLFMPFMTYPHEMLLQMARLYGRGRDGRRALATMATVMFMFAGLMGLPGAELMKELYEKIAQQYSGIDNDIELMIREKIYDTTGSVRAGKFVTQGFGRAFLNLDIAKRLGLPIPGQDIALMAMGDTTKKTTDMFGVPGSILPSVFNAWNSYNNDAATTTVLSSVAPTAIGNLLKAVQYVDEGATTKSGNMLVTADKMKASTVALRALGYGSDQVAAAREQLYYGKIMAQTKYKVAMDRYRAKAKNHYTRYIQSEEKGDMEAANEHFKEYKSAMQEYIEFCEKNKIPVDVKSFNRSVFQASEQRVSGKLNYKDVPRHSRDNLEKLQQVLGTE